ncbi:MAG: 50S ribosomal protein L10 [Deltaproteobacteria bacterium]|nr:50S ribosomal protein L10 [Deltaproteobacteria bacterium]
MDRAGKQVELEAISSAFKSAQSTLCADYRGLTVAEITELRKELRRNGARGKVVKNTLGRLAAERAYKDADAAQLKKFIELFGGPSLIVTSDSDPVAPAKIMAKFAKDHKNLKIKGGWIDGQCLDQAGVDTLAKMPGREETLSKLLALIAAPATQLVRLLAAPATQVVRVVDAHRQNLEKKG